MNGIILYKSKYGATKKYAGWLSESTGFSCIETDKSDIKVISGYDVIILGGGIYASGIAGLSFLKKNIEKLKEKKLKHKKRNQRNHKFRFLKKIKY